MTPATPRGIYEYGMCFLSGDQPQERVAHGAKCGHCGRELFNGEVANATADTSDKYLQDNLPVVIDFWAPCCGPCVNFAPVFKEVAHERSGQVRFIKVNTKAET